MCFNMQTHCRLVRPGNSDIPTKKLWVSCSSSELRSHYIFKKLLPYWNTLAIGWSPIFAHASHLTNILQYGLRHCVFLMNSMQLARCLVVVYVFIITAFCCSVNTPIVVFLQHHHMSAHYYHWTSACCSPCGQRDINGIFNVLTYGRTARYRPEFSELKALYFTLKFQSRMVPHRGNDPRSFG